MLDVSKESASCGQADLLSSLKKFGLNPRSAGNFGGIRPVTKLGLLRPHLVLSHSVKFAGSSVPMLRALAAMGSILDAAMLVAT